ncbi:MAG TPA: carbohydrate binding family 9 domain-containing protein [Candidatus Angelobacter sp.]|nr:carbohydrate binding family 9 domain-containing protein [Candidatus Angelobacter sp.]
MQSCIKLPLLFFVFLIFCFPSPASAAIDDSSKPAPPERQSVHIKRFTSPPALDGSLGPDWSDAQVPAEFFEVAPLGNVAAPVKTVAYLGYDSQNLYFAFRCFDPNPGAIRANLTERDHLNFDDFAGLYLDTFGDGHHAYEFMVNARGVQMDAFRTEGQPEDFTWDGRWTSVGRVTEDGYIVQAKIPLTNLMYSAKPVQDWRFLLIRVWPREQGKVEMMNFKMDYDNPCLICQFPELQGVEGVRGTQHAQGEHDWLDNFSVLATLTTHRTDRPFQLQNHTNSAVDPGVFLNWSPRPSTQIQFTAHPDFSQVEADVNQLAINNRFVLFFPERRPFFQETNDIFAAPGTPGGFYFDGYGGIASGTSGRPLDLFYSRSITQPLAAGKLTQKYGRGQLSAFWATDELPTIVVPNPNGSTIFQLPGESVDTAARYTMNIWKNSSVGFSLFDMQLGGGHSIVASTDFLLRPLRNLDITGQYAHSDADALGSIDLLAAFAGRKPTGDAFDFQVDHSGAHHNFQVGYYDISRDFRSDLGFIRQTDLRTLDTSGTVQWIPSDNPAIVRMGPAFRFINSYNHFGLLMERTYSAGLLGVTRGQIDTHLHVDFTTERVSGVQFMGEKRIIGEFQGRPAKWLLPVNASFIVGDLVDLVNVRQGRGYSLGVGGVIRPTSKLAFTIDTSRERLERKDTGKEVYHAQIVRVNTEYYFSKKADIRWIPQYSYVVRDPHQYFLPVLRSNHTLNSYLLFTYRFHPAISLIFGYNDSFVGPKAAQVFDTTHAIDDFNHPRNPGSCATDASVGAAGFQGSPSGLAGQALNSRCRTVFLKLGYTFHP